MIGMILRRMTRAACSRVQHGGEVRLTLEERLVLTSRRGPGFDHIRLIAASIVVLHHCRGIQYTDIRNDPLFHYSAGFMDFGRFAVVIFFAVSGFLVTPSLLRTGVIMNFLINRVVRIVPGLFVNIVVSMLVLGPILTTYSFVSYASSPDLYLYAKNLLTLMVRHLPGVVDRNGDQAIINGALWTLHFEALCYIALAVSGVIGFLRRPQLFLVSWGATYILYVIMMVDPSVASHLPDRLTVFIELFVYFGFGTLLYLFRMRIPFSPALAGLAVVLLFGVLPIRGGPVVMPICLPYLSVCLGLSSPPGGEWLKRDISYGVYLIHAPILLLVTQSLPGLKMWWVGALIVFSITIPLALMSWAYVEGPALKQKRVVAAHIHRAMDTILGLFRTDVVIRRSD